MQKGDTNEVQRAFGDLTELSNAAKGIHESLLPRVEVEKQDTWFKAKMIANEERFTGRR